MQGPIPLHAYVDRDVDADASSGGSGSTCTAGGTVTIYESDILREFPGTSDSSGASNPPEGWTGVVSFTVCAPHKKGEEVLQNRFIPRDWDKGYYAAEITCVHGDGSNGITFINNIPCISVFINREDLQPYTEETRIDWRSSPRYRYHAEQEE